LIPIPGIRIFKIVVEKLIAPKIEEVPKINRLKIQIASPALLEIKLNGG
jgi:hypothetical protein